MALFAVNRQAGPAWDPSVPMREQEGWDQHASVMDALADEGVVVGGGPVDGSDAGPAVRVLLICEGADEAGIRRCLDADPWEPAGLLTSEIHAWELLVGVPSRWTASTVYADMWLDPGDDPRETDTGPADERTTLMEYLRAYRLTLEMKCADLSPAQLARRSVPPSTMSLLGLLRHMAKVEQHWFRLVLAGEDVPPLYSSDADHDLDWNGAVADADVVARAWGDWRKEVTFAERFVEGATDFDVVGRRSSGQVVSLRDVLVHMIEEYARHCGHADLLRERTDGRVGQ